MFRIPAAKVTRIFVTGGKIAIVVPAEYEYQHF
jgi:hypothetical protein